MVLIYTLHGSLKRIFFLFLSLNAAYFGLTLEILFVYKNAPILTAKLDNPLPIKVR